MIENDYLPTSDEELLPWLKNFSKQLYIWGVSFDITVSQFVALDTFINETEIYIHDGVFNEKLELEKKVMIKYVRYLVEKIKKHPAYQESVEGKKLGIANSK